MFLFDLFKIFLFFDNSDVKGTIVVTENKFGLKIFEVVKMLYGKVTF